MALSQLVNYMFGNYWYKRTVILFQLGSSHNLILLILGVVRIKDPLQFSLQSASTANLPLFTLTCISTGGPATTVSWTLDGAAVSGATSQTVVDQQTATYHNTLTVTGRLPGIYQCNVTNARTTQPATASVTVASESSFDYCYLH